MSALKVFGVILSLAMLLLLGALGAWLTLKSLLAPVSHYMPPIAEEEIDKFDLTINFEVDGEPYSRSFAYGCELSRRIRWTSDVYHGVPASFPVNLPTGDDILFFKPLVDVDWHCDATKQTTYHQRAEGAILAVLIRRNDEGVEFIEKFEQYGHLPEVSLEGAGLNFNDLSVVVTPLQQEFWGDLRPPEREAAVLNNWGYQTNQISFSAGRKIPIAVAVFEGLNVWDFEKTDWSKDKTISAGLQDIHEVRSFRPEDIVPDRHWHKLTNWFLPAPYWARQELSGRRPFRFDIHTPFSFHESDASWQRVPDAKGVSRYFDTGMRCMTTGKINDKSEYELCSLAAVTPSFAHENLQVTVEDMDVTFTRADAMRRYGVWVYSPASNKIYVFSLNRIFVPITVLKE